MRASPATAGVLAGAVVISAVTVLARAAGVGRALVFQHAVGPSDLGTAYQTANTVPNVLFEVVAGGALASVVVPVLAASLRRGDREHASQVLSALLTWTTLLLVPVTVVAALLVGPIMSLLLAGQGSHPAEVLTAGRGFLLLFLPQVVLYGLAVVGGAALQAAGRFFWPAAAPLVSSLVVAAAYLLFAASGADPSAAVSSTAQLILGLGTTAGVLCLALAVLVPVRTLGLTLRPELHFPPGVARRVRRLAGAGAAALAAQQLSVVVVLRLANSAGRDGPTVTYANTWMVFLLPYALLAVPLATSAYPRLSAAAEDPDRAGFDRLSAATVRAVVVASSLGAAALFAASSPLARLFAVLDGSPAGPSSAQMARALIGFAPGLVAYGMVLVLSRALYALGRARVAAAATSAGWLGVVAADLALVALVPDRTWVVAALGLGNTVGMILGAVLLGRALRSASGPGALRGLRRSGIGSGLGVVVGGGLGAVVDSAQFGPGGLGRSLAAVAVTSLVAALGWLACVAVADRDALRQVLLRRPGRHESEVAG